MRTLSASSASWAVVGADLFCPVAVAPAPGRLALFARDVAGALVRRDWRDGRWTEPRSLGVPVALDSISGKRAPVDWQLAACCGGNGGIELFGRSPDNALVHAVVEPSSPSLSFEYLGAPAAQRDGVVFPMGLIGPPAVCARDSGRVEVFALGQGGDLLRVARVGGEWQEFESLGVPSMHLTGTRAQPVPSTPVVAACACGTDRIAVFVCAALGALLLKWWDGRQWSEFASLGVPEVREASYPAVTVAGRLTGPPAACSWGPGRLDVFARGPRGELMHRAWNGREWGGYTSLWMPMVTEGGSARPTPLTGAVTACTRCDGCIDVFATALDGRLHHARFDGGWTHD